MSLATYVDWMRDHALPFWLMQAADSDGVFHETLALDGTPEPEVELRLRTGMRQVYVFAHAAHLGLIDRAPALALAERLVAHMRGCAWAPDGRPGWVARFGRDGGVTDDRRDLYDHAFALHALASLYVATRNPLYLAWVDDTLDVVDRVLAAPHGGWAESDRHELPRRQNPHMHLFEACLALFEATGEARHLARAGEIFGLFRCRLFDQATGILGEFFAADWGRGPDSHAARLDPGHMMEWTWLLRRYERATGRPVDDLCAALFDSAVRLGLGVDGFLVDEADAGGRPLLDRRRLWPQTEYLKALIVQGTALRDPTPLRQADALVGRLFASYLTGIPQGAWRDQFSLNGQPTAANIPASTLYHLFAAAVEILRLDGVERSAASGQRSRASAGV